MYKVQMESSCAALTGIGQRVCAELLCTADSEVCCQTGSYCGSNAADQLDNGSRKVSPRTINQALLVQLSAQHACQVND